MTNPQVTQRVGLRGDIKIEDKERQRTIRLDAFGLVHVARYLDQGLRRHLSEGGQNRREHRLVRFQNENALLALTLSGWRFLHGVKRRGRWQLADNAPPLTIYASRQMKSIFSPNFCPIRHR